MNFLKQSRIKNGLTQKDMQRILKCCRSTITSIEGGNLNCKNIHFAKDIAAAYQEDLWRVSLLVNVVPKPLQNHLNDPEVIKHLNRIKKRVKSLERPSTSS